MAHARQTVREKLAGLLTAAPAATQWKSVFETRIPPQRRVEPYLLVYVTEEQVGTMTIHGPAIQERTAIIAVQGYLLLSDKQVAEDRMDAMAAAVETRLTLAALQAVSGAANVSGLQLQSTQMEIVGEDDKAPTHAVMTMTYQVEYQTAEGAPETLI